LENSARDGGGGGGGGKLREKSFWKLSQGTVVADNFGLKGHYIFPYNNLEQDIYHLKN
jgi:hypothetical protein